MQASEFWFVRHGQTDWNVDQRLQGHEDVPLNEAGRQQAAAAATYLQGLHATARFDAIVSSDLSRALATAEAIRGALGITTIETDAGLREHALGSLQGHVVRAMPPHLRREYDNLRTNPDYKSPGGGESSREMFERVVRTLDSLPQRYPGQRVLVTTHGGWLFHAHRYLLQLSIDRSQDAIPNACICIVRFEPSTQAWSIHAWGVTDHLKQAGSGV